MNKIKRVFSIKDLENLSGIKAHTIRIWEKRYNLLSPMRTDTNIRNYSIKSLQKLLNVTLLYENGYKISKIASFSEDKIIQLAKGIINETSVKSQAINAFKLAMINFDQTMFYSTYAALLEHKSFREIFYDIFIPLLNELGLLWQTDTITPAHEHFVSNLIKQKILINTEKLQRSAPNNNAKTFVLYLPENEIHEIGLLFLNYEIVLRGYHSIYLGPSMPIENLQELTTYYDQLVFLTYFTVQPATDKVEDYVSLFQQTLNKQENHQLWLIGKKINDVLEKEFPKGVNSYSSIIDLVKDL
ncbi:B12 binding domain-containing protein [Pustulibacterium marinum]|uniref:B12 binding domain-containing protein n=1 Tax=Pustulibacterium marinum TaxID=1224947 RepID=A0A1I7FRV5_9FLAO|nr:MerR family transcriptional regulator [Pustulibacterium marinum]SFU38736.1 B12 binding domain-containing protein [Pustulibacterium marinum]